MNYYYITGTSSGLGKAIAEQLLEREDAFVYGISRTSSIQHKKYYHVFADLSDPGSLNVITTLFNTPYTVDDSIYLINNAGVIDPIKYVQDFSEDEIQTLLQVNLIASIQLISAFLKISAPVKKSVIISVSSGAATKVIDGWSLYGTAKAALDHFSLHVSKELEIKKVSNSFVFSVAPGVVDTAMQLKIRQTPVESFSTLDRFMTLFETGELASASVIAQKYLRILDHPNDFPKVVFSIRDLA
jgi:benzil reductase ((S)-benzoin forming)